MAILVDTNILLRSVQPHHPHYPIVERAFSVLRSNNESLHVAVQNLVEFWAVASRPAGSQNGLGMTPQKVAKELAVLKDLFTLLSEPVSIFQDWEQFVTSYRVSGRNTHDARLVAVMKAHSIGTILTFNVQDFARYKDIAALHPETLA
jgi:predicted nucleic acid-binding protein